MTQIRETGFSLDLPGTWEAEASPEPGGFGYHQSDGEGSVTVMLLSVRPVYAIADRMRLLGDYMQHRATYEQGLTPTLEQSDPTSHEVDGVIEGEWRGVDAVTGRQRVHRLLFVNSVLGDFCFEDSGLDQTAFDERAALVLRSASLSVE